MTIFDDIASGADRLRRGEDALIWNMRAAGKTWREIGAALLVGRAERRERCEAQVARCDRSLTAARNARAQLRAERAER